MATARLTRMAFLLERASGTSLQHFAAGLSETLPALKDLAVAVGGHVRAGTRHPDDPLAGIAEETIDRPFGTIQGAVEISAETEPGTRLCDQAGEAGRILDGLFDPEHSALVVGETHHVLGPIPGPIFLSLAFSRFPGTSVDEFRAWWLHEHAKVATRLLSPELLAYDQVHVDRGLSKRCSAMAGIAYHPFDAYDNLTWDSLNHFIESVSKPGGRDEMYADEAGHIDHSTYRGALMSEIASSGRPGTRS